MSVTVVILITAEAIRLVGYLSLGFSIHVIYLSSYPYAHHGPLLLSVSCRLFSASMVVCIEVDVLLNALH